MDPTKGDSQLVIDQIKGTGEAKDPQMVKYLGKSKELIKPKLSIPLLFSHSSLHILFILRIYRIH